jgi:hypothetical protein
MRTTLLLAFLKLRDQAVENEFSRLWKQLNGDYPAGHWQQESKMPVLGVGISAHYAYHGAFIWQESIVAAFDATTFDDAAKRLVISNYTKLLLDNDPLAAQRYAQVVLEFASKGERATLSISNLPASVLVVTNLMGTR